MSDTAPAAEVGSHPPDDEPALPPPEPATLVAVICGFAGVLLLCIGLLLPVPYVILEPGPVLNTLGAADGSPLITVRGRKTYPTTGELDLTTVSARGGPGRRLNLLEVGSAWLRSSSTVVPQELYYPPGQTQEQSRQLDEASMVSSQESATVAALTELDIDVPADIAVAGVRPGAPAEKVFRFGDVIQALDGTRITSLEALRAGLGAREPGDVVRVQVLRDGARRTLAAPTTADRDTGRTVLDVFVDQRFQLPFTVKIQIENIGGPSAGQMFALGLIDTLTPGDLTGGRKIAGSGTIDPSGAIGPIGGIRQKLVGARRAGAGYFLAPADNCPEVLGHVPDGLRVIRTATLAESRAELAKIAAGRDAELTPC